MAEPDWVDEQLRGLLVEALGEPQESVSPDSPLGGLGLDSLGLVSFAAMVEAAIGIELPDIDLEMCVTFGDFAAVVRHALDEIPS